MSIDKHSEQEESPAGLRLSVSPPPTNEEFVAIAQALELLGEHEDQVEPRPNESPWSQVTRHETLRKRNWSYQERCWAHQRW
jgi:hypothetical protein